MGPTALLPLRRKAEDFLALKNPTASAGFEPANLGTKGQHATFRPPKPLTFPLGWNAASSLKIKRGRKVSSSMFWSLRSQNSTRFHLSFGRRACTSCRRYGFNSKRHLNTRQTFGCSIPSSLLALPVDLRGLHSKLS